MGRGKGVGKGKGNKQGKKGSAPASKQDHVDAASKGSVDAPKKGSAAPSSEQDHVDAASKGSEDAPNKGSEAPASEQDHHPRSSKNNMAIIEYEECDDGVFETLTKMGTPIYLDRSHSRNLDHVDADLMTMSQFGTWFADYQHALELHPILHLFVKGFRQ
ncbi:hypothetical protein OROHE_024520 [Orobanche hederae]